MRVNAITLILLLMICIPGRCVSAPLEVNINLNSVLRSDADRWIGIDLNYIRDLDVNRPRATPLNQALRSMGARWLRYPGGEKSDFHMFATEPYTKASPVSLKWYAEMKGERLNYDEYIRCCRQTGAEPFVVVGCDNEKRTGKTWDQWLQHAIAWVRYSKLKGYHVKYWEIGNENWCNNTAQPQEMAYVITRFALAMKKEDPTIKVGASVNEWKEWIQALLQTAGPHIDFLTQSVYNCWAWGSYDYIIQHPETNLISSSQSVLSMLKMYAQSADYERIKLIITETNSKDYSVKNGWVGDNTLGHALVSFETFGRLLQEPKIEAAMLWTTRWMNDDEAKTSQWYGLGPKNNIMPAGNAVEAWGRYLQKNIVTATGSKDQIVAFASASPNSKRVSVWLLNRGYKPQSVVVKLSSKNEYVVKVHRLKGIDANDTAPIWEDLPQERQSGWNIGLRELPSLSITVLECLR